MNVFDRINDYIRSTENSAVNLLSAIAPWGAPLAPAYMSYNGMVSHLGYTPFVAGVVALVIEVLGLATVHTTITFWQYNRRRLAEYKRRPTLLAGAMFAVYLVIILTVNVLLEWPHPWEYMPTLARSLLSLLTVPAAVTLAIRALHTDMIAEATRTQPKRNQRQPDATKSNRELLLELHHAQPQATHAQLAEAVGVSRQYVDKVIKQNGKPHN